MSERLDIPLVANLDATHCFQACIKTMLEARGRGSYTWEELDTISAKVEGLWTWPIATWLWMQRHSFEPNIINTFDYDRFSKEGPAYLVEYFNEETAAALIRNSDIEQERRLAAQLLEEVTVKCRVPDFEDIQRALGRQSLACCSINSNKLNGLPGFMGHFVVVTGYDEKTFYLNDPGGVSRPVASPLKVASNAGSPPWSFIHLL